MAKRLFAFGLFLTAFCLGASLALAGGPRVLPEGKQPDDVRLGELRTLDSYFPFQVPDSPEAWEKHAELTRRRILVAMGLYPMPAPTPANAVVHGAVERPGYAVERVYLESFPGHFVTGSLYRPTGRSGRLPGVLCPHGHWANGRFYDAGEENAKKEIANGAESMLIPARYPLQARCVQLARMGCVVFHYDMIGYADSQQIPADIAHGFRNRRPDMEQNDSWGFFSPQAESRLQSIMGVQTYNSIRTLDWFSSLPDVDPQRIAVTGASGGGTQTFILGAIDPRVAVAFPAVMVSTAMQGGCTCENACYLRTGVGNIDFAACFAPRPLGMTAANDWTVELEKKGLPELKRLFTLLNEPGHVHATIRTEFGHNYNEVSRMAMYHWFNKHLHLGHAEPIREQDFEPLSQAEMTVWTDGHAKPASSADVEKSLTKTIDEASSLTLASDPTRFTRGAYEVIVGRGVPKAHEVVPRRTLDEDRGTYREIAGLVELPARGEQVPEVFLLPKGEVRGAVVWIDGRGKQAIYDEQGKPVSDIQRLLDAGWAVTSADLIGTGEWNGGAVALEENRRVSEDRNFAGYTYGYNSPLFVQRVHDILTVLGLTAAHCEPGQQIHLVGVHGAGPQVALAALQAGETVDRVAIDTEGFRFANVASYADPQFLPGAVKYGDLPGILRSLEQRPLLLAGEGTKFAVGVASPTKTAEDYSSAVVDWLLSDASGDVAK